MKITSPFILLIYLLTGCATTPKGGSEGENISKRYDSYDCATLTEERERIQLDRLALITGEHDSKQTTKVLALTAGLVPFAVASSVISMLNDTERDRLLAENEAVKRVGAAKGCFPNIPPGASGEPAPNAKAPSGDGMHGME
jgi:hypothetical protein